MQEFSICFFKTILDFSRETGKILPTNSEMFQSPENSANTYQGKFTCGEEYLIALPLK